MKILYPLFLIVLIFFSCHRNKDNTPKTTKDTSNNIITQNQNDSTHKPPVMKYDFRKAVWGISRKEVKQSESFTIYGETKNEIFYDGNILNFDAYIIYFFIDDKLVSTNYVYKIKHINKNDYIRDYEIIKKTLITKYGQPMGERVDWKNDLFRDDPSQWGMAISAGHLIYISRWETDRTEILHSLYGDNFEIKFATVYNGKAYQKLQEEKERNEAEKAF